MTQTKAPPLDDKSMWRQLVSPTHPDRAGSDDLFIWMRELQERVCSGALKAPRPEPPPQERSEEPERVSFTAGLDFAVLTRRAVEMADGQPLIYARLLRMLDDYHPSPLYESQQERGAIYKQLAAIGHKAGMDKRERVGWYRVAESIPLSEGHARYLLEELGRTV